MQRDCLECRGACWAAGGLARGKGGSIGVQESQARCRRACWGACWGGTQSAWGSGGPGREQRFRQRAGGLAAVQGGQAGCREPGWDPGFTDWELLPNDAVRGRFDLATLPVDFVECLMRFLPTEAEAKALRQYERERKPLEELADEDRFMLQFSKVERLPQRMAIMAFLGNFAENIQMLTPVRSWGGGCRTCRGGPCTPSPG